MSFISYAQNYEDVMLWRALKHIECGFYIDVGANDPEIDSVTKAFYDKGWRGINIEPVSQWFEKLCKVRVRDINLQLALGDTQGELALYEIPDTGLSTASTAFVAKHKSDRGYESRCIDVKLETLTNICESYHIAPIHFLKIDVEGMEKKVIEGTDFSKIRPWIILVESTLPNSQEESYIDWEPILINSDYQYVYFDGLNRFYIASEHSELSEFFRVPPNIFDEFVLKQNIELAEVSNNYQIEAEKLKNTIKKLEHRTLTSEKTINDLNLKIVETESLFVKAKSAISAFELEIGQEKSKVTTLETELLDYKEQINQFENALSQASENNNKISKLQKKITDLNMDIMCLNHEADNLKQKLYQEQKNSKLLLEQFNVSQIQIDDLNNSVHHWWKISDNYNKELHNIYNSVFWKITTPIRKLVVLKNLLIIFLQKIFFYSVSIPKKILVVLLTKAMYTTIQSDKLRYKVLSVINRYPKIKGHLRAFANNRGIIASRTSSTISASDDSTEINPGLSSDTDEFTGKPDLKLKMTPRAKKIFSDLKFKLEANSENF